MTDRYAGNGDGPSGGSPSGAKPDAGANRPSSQIRTVDRGAQWRRFLRPGIGIKRWLLVAFVGALLLALGLALLLRSTVNQFLDVATLGFLPPEVRLIL